jgi:hypothetical protein
MRKLIHCSLYGGGAFQEGKLGHWLSILAVIFVATLSFFLRKIKAHKAAQPANNGVFTYHAR